MDDYGNKAERWSDYWKQGFITSFGKGMSDNYQDGFTDFWHAQFESLNNGSVLLDLATGNGAIATMAVEFSEKASKDLVVLAADAAVINTDLIEESDSLLQYRKKIQFFSSTPCEKLSFENDSVDLVCAQFGIEYSVLAESIPEVSRVLREGGQFAAIMHHAESRIILDAIRQQAILDDALNKHQVLDILETFFNALGPIKDAAAMQIARQQQPVAACERQLGGAVMQLQQKYPNSSTIKNFINCVNKFAAVNAFQPQESRIAELNDLKRNYQNTLNRQDDLQEAAMSAENMQDLHRLATKSGLKDFTYNEKITSDGRIGGWLVTAHT